MAFLVKLFSQPSRLQQNLKLEDKGPEAAGLSVIRNDVKIAVLTSWMNASIRCYSSHHVTNDSVLR